MTTGDAGGFVPGHRLAGALYDVVAALLARLAPGLPYAAALVGRGSDVLGYDTPRSTDHDWGPRLTVLLPAEQLATWRPRILAAVDNGLPAELLGVPVALPGSQHLPGDPVVHHHASASTRRHGVGVSTLAAVTTDLAGVDLTGPIGPATWLSVSQQALLELTAGPQFRDDTGELTRLRRTLAWYPDDVWRYMLAARWMRVAQLEPFVGRTGEVGDDLGSQLIALRIGTELVHLAFLQERRYAPYPKWLGTAFGRLGGAAELAGHLDSVRYARDWPERERHLLPALELLAHRQNALHLAPTVPVVRSRFFDRPFTVLFAERIVRALREVIVDPQVQALPAHVGDLDTVTDSTDLRADRGFQHAFATWLDQPRPPTA